MINYICYLKACLPFRGSLIQRNNWERFNLVDYEVLEIQKAAAGFELVSRGDLGSLRID